MKSFMFVGIGVIFLSGVLIYPVLPMAEGSSPEDGLTTAYSMARKAGTPFSCKFEIPSFGEPSQYEAKIIADDFMVVDTTHLLDEEADKETSAHYVRKDDIGYYWLFSFEGPSNPLRVTNAKKFHYTKIRKAYELMVEKAGQGYQVDLGANTLEFQVPFFFVSPPPDAQCEETQEVDIKIPEIPFYDATEDMLAAFNSTELSVEDRMQYLMAVLSPDWEDRLREQYKEQFK